MSRDRILSIAAALLIAGTLILTACGGASTTITGPLAEFLELSKGITSIKYDMVTHNPGMPEVTQTVYLKQNMVRIEMSTEGQNVFNIVDTSKQTVYMYMPDEKMAIKMNMNSMPKTVTDEVAEIARHNPTLNGTETVDNKICLVTQYEDATVMVKSWIWEEKGLLIRTEVKSIQGVSIIEYKNFDFSDLADSLFELPAGIEIVDTSS
jgi:hypothetical protein